MQSEYPHPKHFLLHLSDTHLVDGEILYGAVNSTERLGQVMLQILGSGEYPDAVIVTGDLADEGEPAAYLQLRAWQTVFDNLGVKIIWAMGNHDNREAMREYLLEEDPSTDPVDRVDWVGGLRIITLDTSVPGEHYGELTDDQLEWLKFNLFMPAPDGTILAMHHPPLPCAQELAVLVELRGQKRLADAIRGSEIRAILAGHMHYSSFGTFAGIPVSVATSSCYTQDLNTSSDPNGVRGLRGRDAAQGHNMVHVYDDTILHSVVPIDYGKTVGERTSAERASWLLSTFGVTFPA